MPAATHHDNGSAAEDAIGAGAGTGDGDGATATTVTDHLDRALEVAREHEMSAGELMGLFFYYAHSIAESYRQDALGQDGGG